MHRACDLNLYHVVETLLHQGCGCLFLKDSAGLSANTSMHYALMHLSGVPSHHHTVADVLCQAWNGELHDDSDSSVILSLSHQVAKFDKIFQ